MNVIQRFEKNDLGRDFVVGDIHGCFDMLRKALELRGFDEDKDRLFSVGDLVDRGKQSTESLDWLAKPWFHAVRGNHEQMAIGVAAGRHNRFNYMQNGGAWFLELEDEEQQRFAAAFDELPHLIEVQTDAGRIGIVHAEIEGNSWDAFVEAMSSAPSNNKFNSLQETALWERHRIRHKETTPISDLHMLYVGHTPVQGITQLGNILYIDTGAVFGRELSVVQL